MAASERCMCNRSCKILGAGIQAGGWGGEEGCGVRSLHLQLSS